MSSWELAPSLVRYRDCINVRFAKRDKRSDGSIGDPAHAARMSDHNPNERGRVNAIDVDEDLLGVPTSGRHPLIKHLIDAFERHPSAHYWIYEQEIASSDNGWKREPYYGDNKHDKHVHFSIKQTRAAEENTTPWKIETENAMWDELFADNTSTKKRFGNGPRKARTYLLLAAEYAYDAAQGIAKTLIMLRDLQTDVRKLSEKVNNDA